MKSDNLIAPTMLMGITTLFLVFTPTFLIAQKKKAAIDVSLSTHYDLQETIERDIEIAVFNDSYYGLSPAGLGVEFGLRSKNDKFRYFANIKWRHFSNVFRIDEFGQLGFVGKGEGISIGQHIKCRSYSLGINHYVLKNDKIALSLDAAFYRANITKFARRDSFVQVGMATVVYEAPATVIYRQRITYINSEGWYGGLFGGTLEYNFSDNLLGIASAHIRRGFKPVYTTELSYNINTLWPGSKQTTNIDHAYSFSLGLRYIFAKASKQKKRKK